MRAVTAALLLSALSAQAGCASSAVIPASDETFARATDRLERTMARVDASGASPRERALFFQAEALYRYRFAGTPGSAAVLAEAAAAATDLPVLQSLSGSLDVVDLRMRSSDAAVQLWETFLQRHPTSPLRPLALYRLGFAYRSASAEGLPRSSGDDAWAELARSSPPEDLGSAAGAARGIAWKSKTTAATLSLVPGLGQLYVGESVGGSIRLGVAIVAAAAVIAPAVIAATRASDLSWRRDWPLLVSSIGGLIVLSFDYTSSYEDAMRGVVRWNEREEARFEAAHPDAP